MNTIDIILSLFFIIVTYFGFKKGIIKQLTNISNTFIALIVSYIFSGGVSMYVKDIFSIPSFYASGLAFIITFILVIILISFLTRLIEIIIKKIHLTFLNQILGGLFAFVKYGLFLFIPFTIFNILNQKFNFHSSSVDSFWFGLYENLSKSFFEQFY